VEKADFDPYFSARSFQGARAALSAAQGALIQQVNLTPFCSLIVREHFNAALSPFEEGKWGDLHGAQHHNSQSKSPESPFFRRGKASC
jgi:hypothetical protein